MLPYFCRTLYLNMRKIFYGHCIQVMQKIAAMLKKKYYVLCPLNLHSFMFNPQFILYFYMYCMGQDKKKLEK